MNKKEILITILLFVIIFSIRLPYINNAPPESGDMWRQPDTESIARNFVNHRFNIFYPQFNYDGPLPNYIQLEFQITTFLIAILYKIFGYHRFLARLVPTIFFIISVYYLFKLVKEIYSTKSAWITIFIYSILPLNLFYSRAIMPESAALCFFNGAFYYFYKWYKTEQRLPLFLAGIFTSLTISQKTPAVFIGLAMIFMCIDKYNISFLKKWELWIFGLIALVPPYVYTKWAGTVAEFTFVSAIGAKHILPKFVTSFLTIEAYDFYKINLPRSFTVVILILAVIGLFTIRKKAEKPLLYLSMAILLEVIFIVSVIKFRYYLIFLAPVIAILAGKTLFFLFSKGKPGLVFTVLLLVYAACNAFVLVKDDFKVCDSIIEFSQIVDTHTNEGDLIVIGTPDPARLSMSSRQGWRANAGLYGFMPKDIEGEVNYFIENGAKYFVVESHYIYGDDGSYIKYLEENFNKIEFEDKYQFYIVEAVNR